MKKFLAFAVVILFTLGCSEDSETPAINDVNQNILLKKSVVITNGGEPVTATYSYNGLKLTNIDYSDGRRQVYTYDDIMVTNIKEYMGENLLSNEDFEYTPFGFLISNTLTYYNGDTEVIKTTYLENEANDIVVRIHGLDSQNHFYLMKQVVMKMNGTNISQINTSNMAGESELETVVYSYDNKNNPFRNMHGNKFLVMARRKGGANNIRQHHWTKPGEIVSSELAYTYDSNNFPVTSTETINDGTIINTEYFYE